MHDFMAPGTIIDGTYKIVRLLGRGGMSAVYEAELAPNRTQRCAVKVLLPGSRYGERFHQEWQVLSAIHHANLIHVYGRGRWQNYQYYAMELIPDLLSEEQVWTLSVSEKVEITIQSAKGLQALHRSGVIHRDVKPSNIFVYRENGKLLAKIADLGIARQEDSMLTASGVILGTPQYMSPEQIENSRYVDHRCDIYGLGATLYTWLTGVMPYHSENSTHSLLLVCNHVPPEPILAINPQVPAQLAEVVEKKMMSFSRDDRFTNMHRLIHTLQLLLPTFKAQFAPTRKAIVYQAKAKDYQEAKTLSTRSRRRLTTAKHRRHSRQLRLGQYAIVITALTVVIALFSLFALQGDPAPSLALAKEKPIIASGKTNSEQLQSAIDLLREGKNEECAAVLQKLRISEEQELASDPLTRLVALFYADKWTEALLVAPEVIQREDLYSGVGLFFCVRLFACVEERALATWYGYKLRSQYPDFAQSLGHPAVSATTGRYQEAYRQLQSWQDPERQSEKKHLEFFLYCDISHKLQKKANIAQLEQSAARCLSHSLAMDLFTAYRAYIQGDIAQHMREHERTSIKHPYCFESAFHINGWRVEKNRDFANAIHDLQALSALYPDFTAIRILTGFPRGEQPCFVPEIDKNALYNCIIGYTRQRNMAKALHYSQCLREDHPYWWFSYLYYGENLIDKGDFSRGLDETWRSMRVSPPRVAARYLQNFAIYARRIPAAQLLPHLHRIHWVFNRLDKVYGRPLPSYCYRQLKKLEPLIEQLSDQIPAIALCNKRYSIFEDHRLVLEQIDTSRHPYAQEWGVRYLIERNKNEEALLRLAEMRDTPEKLFLSSLISVELAHQARNIQSLEKAWGDLRDCLAADNFYARDYLFALEVDRLLRLCIAEKRNDIAQQIYDELVEARISQSFLAETKWFLAKSRNHFTPGLLQQFFASSIEPQHYLERAECYIALGNNEQARSDLDFAGLLIELRNDRNRERERLAQLRERLR